MDEEKKKELLAKYNSVDINVPMKEAIEALESLECAWHVQSVRVLIDCLREALES